MVGAVEMMFLSKQSRKTATIKTRFSRKKKSFHELHEFTDVSRKILEFTFLDFFFCLCSHILPLCSMGDKAIHIDTYFSPAIVAMLAAPNYSGYISLQLFTKSDCYRRQRTSAGSSALIADFCSRKCHITHSIANSYDHP